MSRVYQRNRRRPPSGRVGGKWVGTYHWVVGSQGVDGLDWWIKLHPFETVFEGMVVENWRQRGLPHGPVVTEGIKHYFGSVMQTPTSIDVIADELVITGTSAGSGDDYVYVLGGIRQLVTSRNLWNQYWDGKVWP
jgi:hypothetical protein